MIEKGITMFYFLALAGTMGSCQVNNTSPVEKYLDKKSWDSLFPHRYGKDAKSPQKKKTDFYSFGAFVSAAKHFPLFLAEGNDSTRRRELAAFLANIAQETSGGWASAPGGYYKWGLYFTEEQFSDGAQSAYADTAKRNYAPVAGKFYYGRGPKQLSWNYNYGQLSEAWFGNKDSLLQHPERLAEDPVLSFASAIWFWMAAQPPKPSCHDIMTGKWQPTAADLDKGRLPGFGATVNVINGGIECGTGATAERTKYRYGYYHYFCGILQVAPGPGTSCAGQAPFGR